MKITSNLMQNRQNTQKAQKSKKTSFLNKQVKNADLYKLVLNKITASQEQYIKYNYVTPLIKTLALCEHL